MKRLNRMRKNTAKVNFITLLSVVIVGMISRPALTQTPETMDPGEHEVTQGALRVKIADEVVECPLKHTDVKVNITGSIARVTVTQTFYNPYNENIAAVYVFPLPSTATMDAMTIRIGDRKIVSVMKTASEAYIVYNNAYHQVRQRREIAGLLEQESPNTFTQSVEDIKPHQEVHIEISYIDVLPYDRGTYEFHFPMVVGPQYIHVTPNLRETRTAGRFTSHATCSEIRHPPRTRHPFSVFLDAGVPIQDVEIVNHRAAVERIGDAKAKVEISPVDSMPNKELYHEIHGCQ